MLYLIQNLCESIFQVWLAGGARQFVRSPLTAAADRGGVRDGE